MGFTIISSTAKVVVQVFKQRGMRRIYYSMLDLYITIIYDDNLNIKYLKENFADPRTVTGLSKLTLQKHINPL